GPNGDLIATQTGTSSSSTKALQLEDLRGDIIATADPASGVSATTLAPTATYDTDEFGVPRANAALHPYEYLGAKRRTTELASNGAVLMGQRLYLPTLGRFTQTDPVAGGSANDYDYANQDPVNQYDLGGTCALSKDLFPSIYFDNHVTLWEVCKR